MHSSLYSWSVQDLCQAFGICEDIKAKLVVVRLVIGC